jgi:biotin carboxylase
MGRVEQKPSGGRRLLVLGAGAGQLGLLAAARGRGLFVVAVDRDPRAPGFRFADRRAILSLEDDSALERLARAERVDGVIAAAVDWTVATAARIAERVGLPHPLSTDTAAVSSSRLRQRQCLDEAGIPQARWKLVRDAEDELGFPCVVRAPDRHEPRGLSLARSRTELGPAVRRALRVSRRGLCLLEELVEGPEVRVTAFSRAGAFGALTAPERLLDGLLWPSERAEAAIALAGRAAAALGIAEGPTCARIRFAADGPRLIALGARLGGMHDAELCRAALGVDLNAVALSTALGEDLDAARLEPRPRAGGACVRFLRPAAGGPEEAEGVAQAECVDGIEWVWMYGGSDRGGALLATGRSAADARARAGRAAECIRFSTFDAEAVA